MTDFSRKGWSSIAGGSGYTSPTTDNYQSPGGYQDQGYQQSDNNGQNQGEEGWKWTEQNSGS